MLSRADCLSCESDEQEQDLAGQDNISCRCSCHLISGSCDDQPEGFFCGIWVYLSFLVLSMWNLVHNAFRNIISSNKRGSSVWATRDQHRKRIKWDGSCDADHTVVNLLVQGQHVNAHTLAILACVSRSFRNACEDEGIWQLVCGLEWPSMNCRSVEEHVRSSGGYKRLYRVLHSPYGDLQLNPPSNYMKEFMAGIDFHIDINHRTRSVFSLCVNGASDLSHTEAAASSIFQLPDKNIEVVLVDGKGGGLSRRALERSARDLQVSCIALRKKDHKFAILLQGRSIFNGTVGGCVCTTFRASYALPGIFQSTGLSVDAILTVTSKVRDDELNPDEPVVDVILAALGFQVKADFVQRDAGRNKHLESYLELKWK